MLSLVRLSLRCLIVSLRSTVGTSIYPFAFWIIDALRPRVLVELGLQNGDSYCAFIQAVDQLKLGTACYAISLYGEEMIEVLRRYHGPRYGQFSRLISSTFDDATGYFQENSVDLLHIDGVHTYGAASTVSRLGDQSLALARLFSFMVPTFETRMLECGVCGMN
jgi:hypothetical protein